MIKKPFKSFLLAILAITAISACEKREYENIEELDNRNINEYISKNNLNVLQYKATDLFYEVLQEGTGDVIEYSDSYPITYSVRSLDGAYVADDTLQSSNRYFDYFGYFPFSSAAAGGQNSPVERVDDLKDVVKDILGKTNGKIRIIVPSRLTAYGRNGNRILGIPANASLDYTIAIHDNIKNYEDRVIQASIRRAGFTVDEFTKTEDNIYYKILTPGTGAVITKDSTVVTNYKLWDPTGKELDSGTKYSANLGSGTITSWTKIIPLIKKGGKIRFFTPSVFGYGTSGSASVPPFLSLDFEVEVTD